MDDMDIPPTVEECADRYSEIQEHLEVTENPERRSNLKRDAEAPFHAYTVPPGEEPTDGGVTAALVNFYLRITPDS
jgi:hypothetical protein